jgi:hypothetical protein
MILIIQKDTLGAKCIVAYNSQASLLNKAMQRKHDLLPVPPPKWRTAFFTWCVYGKSDRSFTKMHLHANCYVICVKFLNYFMK